MIDEKAPVVLPEFAWSNADSKAFAHLIFRLSNAILVTLLGIVAEEGCVILLRMMCLQICPIQRIQRHADSVRV